MKYIFILLLTSISLVAIAQGDELNDFSEISLTIKEKQRTISSGPGPRSDKNSVIPVWIYVNGVGLSSAAKTRMRNAFKCQLVVSPSRLTRLLCRIRRAGMANGKQYKATVTPEWLIYTLLPRKIFRRAKWCFGNVTCSQTNRIKILGSRWDKIAGHARCLDFFPQITGPPVRDFCGVDGSGFALHAPPVVFAGIDPNLGRP